MHKKHTILYDGKCEICKKWVQRMKKLTGKSISYSPYQEAVGKFSEVTREQCSKSIQLITKKGYVYSGAQAIFKALYLSGRFRWALKLYEKNYSFRKISEGLYRWIARHRGGFDYSSPHKSLLLLGAMNFILFLFLAVIILLSDFIWIETFFFEYVVSNRTEWLNEFFTFITFLGSSDFIYPIAATILVLMFFTKRFGLVLLLAANLIIGGTMYRVFKIILGRDRPDESLFLISADGFSFPSGHATSAVIFYGILAFMLSLFLKKRLLKISYYFLFGILVFLIGISRIYLAVHWPFDVLGGWLLGFSVVFISIYFWNSLYYVEKKD